MLAHARGRTKGIKAMKTWLFTFEGTKGRAERGPNSLYILWGGMGFHIEAACDELRAAILAAER